MVTKLLWLTIFLLASLSCVANADTIYSFDDATVEGKIAVAKNGNSIQGSPFGEETGITVTDVLASSWVKDNQSFYFTFLEADGTISDVIKFSVSKGSSDLNITFFTVMWL